MTPPSASGPLLAALLLASFPGLSYAVEPASAATAPHGLVAFTAPGATTAGTARITLRSLGLVQPAIHQGRAESLTAQTVSDAEATWAAGALNAAADGTPRYYLEVVRPPGAQAPAPAEGSIYDILSNTAAVPAESTLATLTLAQPLPSSLVAAGGSVAFVIRAHWTLATAFGAANSLGLQAGTAATADLVQLYNTGTQAFESYYFSSDAGAGWRNATTEAVAGNTIIYPDEGLVLRRKSVGDRQLVLAGVPQLGVGSISIIPGTNLVTHGRSVAVPLSASGLLESGFAKNEGAGGDEVLLHNGAKYIAYQFKVGGVGAVGWVNSSTRMAEDPVLAPGQALIVKRQGTAGFNWQIPSPTIAR